MYKAVRSLKICSKILTNHFEYLLIPTKRIRREENNVEPTRRLIRYYTVCSGQSVEIQRENTVITPVHEQMPDSDENFAMF